MLQVSGRISSLSVQSFNQWSVETIKIWTNINKSWNSNKEERPSKILESFNIKQKLLDLIKNVKP